MPVQVTYPGVYIQEVPSGVHSIVGVSTSATAFVGVFKRGPTDKATRIDNMGDFERTFGGLWYDSEASYAISQFFLNGGQTAWVVRVAGKNAKAATSPNVGPFTFAALSPGEWGDSLQVAIADGHEGSNGSERTFSLAVRETGLRAGQTVILRTERYHNLTHGSGHRSVEEVLEHESDLIVAQVTGDPGDDSVLHKDTKRSPKGLPGQGLNQIDNPDSEFQWHELTGGDDDVDVTKTDDLTTMILGDESDKTGLHSLGSMEPHIFNILCLPMTVRLDAEGAQPVHSAAATFCEQHRAFYIVDVPVNDNEDEDPVEAAKTAVDQFQEDDEENLSNLSANAAVYFPALTIPDPLRNYRPRHVGASGTIAGLMARTDTDRGIWKAPAGTEATLRGATPRHRLTDAENGELNELGVNVLRTFPTYGNVCWGARTLLGADLIESEWKYVPVRRFALHLENSLFAGTKWAVFEPNAEPLWGQLRLSVGTFMHDLFRQGAFAGSSPDEAYFVHCDETTTTASDILNGIVNIKVGFAPLEPAEFVVISIQQIAPT